MTAPILVLQHTPTEHLGRLAEPLRAGGSELSICLRGRDEPPSPDAVRTLGAIVSLGGPMSANDAATDRFLDRELALLAAAATEGVPVLGLCLGAQLLARALGARVYRNPSGPEIGWRPVVVGAAGRGEPLLGGFRATETVFHWHQDTFDLPPGARLLASSERTERQAFAAGQGLLGLQFHVEVDAPMAEAWAASAGASAELAAAGTSPAAIAEGSRRHAARQVELAEALGRRFARLAAGI